MNTIEKILYFLQKEMETPKPYGWFHWLCISLMIIVIIFLYLIKDRHNEKQLKIVLGIYSIVALILEIIKQIIWSFDFSFETNISTWDYQWYSFPFQLCTTPIYVCITCFFLKNNKLRDSLLSYICFFTILGSISTILMPDSCFTRDIVVNIHTMWLHLGSFVVSVYLLMNNVIKKEKQNLKRATIVFLIFVGIAQVLNIVIYNSGILKDETFNMFYISPYFISTLPIFDLIQKNVPYIIFLAIYVLILIIGANIIYYITSIIKKH